MQYYAQLKGVAFRASQSVFALLYYPNTDFLNLHTVILEECRCLQRLLRVLSEQFVRKVSRECRPVIQALFSEQEFFLCRNRRLQDELYSRFLFHRRQELLREHGVPTFRHRRISVKVPDADSIFYCDNILRFRRQGQ